MSNESLFADCHMKFKWLLYRGEESFTLVVTDLYSCLHHHPHLALWFECRRGGCQGSQCWKSSWFSIIIELQDVFQQSWLKEKKRQHRLEPLVYSSMFCREQKASVSQGVQIMKQILVPFFTPISGSQHSLTYRFASSRGSCAAREDT